MIKLPTYLILLLHVWKMKLMVYKIYVCYWQCGKTCGIIICFVSLAQHTFKETSISVCQESSVGDHPTTEIASLAFLSKDVASQKTHYCKAGFAVALRQLYCPLRSHFWQKSLGFVRQPQVRRTNFRRRTVVAKPQTEFSTCTLFLRFFGNLWTPQGCRTTVLRQPHD